MARNIFIIGAGFNVEARQELDPILGQSIYIGEYEIETGYPLVGDLWQICFDVQKPSGMSFEERLAKEIEQGKFTPLKKMIDALQMADYYIASRHASNSLVKSSSYRAFLNGYPNSTFLTFNYDSLLEIILFRLGHWIPLDGYGIPVRARVEYDGDESPIPAQSNTIVLHLHGSLCVYPSTTITVRDVEPGFDEIRLRDHPQYRFDADSVARCFYPFRRTMPEDGDDEDVARRIVAPVPDKASELQRHFIQSIHRTALKILENAASVMSIGYAFNPLDRVSYSPLLSKICESNATLEIIDPNADEISHRLQTECAGLRTLPRSSTFKEWFQRRAPQ